jgi:hypothetical protein
MSQIQGPGEGSFPITRHDKIQYEREYRDGLNLIRRSFDEYNKADEIHKKEAFHDVMNQALQVMNDSAQALKRSDLLAKNQQIAQSLETMDATQLNQNLKEAKKMV